MTAGEAYDMAGLDFVGHLRSHVPNGGFGGPTLLQGGGRLLVASGQSTSRGMPLLGRQVRQPLGVSTAIGLRSSPT